MRPSTLFSFFTVALPFFASAEHLGLSTRRHNALVSRKRGDLTELQRRDIMSNARATFYQTGLGACGKYNGDNDFIVALNSAQFGSGFPGPNCFKMITINHNGKSTQAQITDECPGCPYGGLDMSPGLFGFFEPLSVGVFQMDWFFNDQGPPPPPKPQPTSSWSPPPSPTSTWSAPKSSSSKTSTWSSSSKSSSSTSPWHDASTSAKSTPTPSATPPPVYGTLSDPQNIQGLNSLIGELGKLVLQSA